MKLRLIEKLEKEIGKANKELHVEIPRALETARAHGDLSENAEFKAAKERQMFLETRLSQLQQRVSDITSLNIDRIPRDRSGLGSTLILKDIESDEETRYHIVFPEEVNPEAGKISAASPIGKALLGKLEGDLIRISLPNSQKEFEVLQVITIHENTEGFNQ